MSRSRGRSVVRRLGKRARGASRARSMPAPRARSARGWASRSLNTHRFTRYAANTSVLSVTASSAANNHEFKLSNIVNAAEFQDLFDQYKINKVVVTYQLITNPDATNYTNSASSAQPANIYPTVWSIPDYDDSSALTIDQMKERIGVKNRVLRPNQKMVFVVRPKILVQTYLTAVSTGYAPKSMFVDMSTATIPHYGLKTVIDIAGYTPNVGFPYLIKQDFKYFFTCKNVR